MEENLVMHVDDQRSFKAHAAITFAKSQQGIWRESSFFPALAHESGQLSKSMV